MRATLLGNRAAEFSRKLFTSIKPQIREDLQDVQDLSQSSLRTQKALAGSEGRAFFVFS
jgi:hypothetical protein